MMNAMNYQINQLIQFYQLIMGQVPKTVETTEQIKQLQQALIQRMGQMQQTYKACQPQGQMQMPQIQMMLDAMSSQFQQTVQAHSDLQSISK